jgi:anti-sigma factor RsiW
LICAEIEERIALHVGGDLPLEEALALEEHLRVCAECAALARGLAADRAWLAIRPEEAGDIDYAAMRREIVQSAVAQSRRNRRWAVALSVAAAILLAVGVTCFRAPLRRRMTPVLRPAPVATPAVAVQTASPPTVRAVRVPVRREPAGPAPLSLEAAIRAFDDLQPPPPAGSDSPVEMRLATRDPRVTIILLQESNGDSQ